MVSMTRATINGSTSGSIIFSMSELENNAKKVTIYCNALNGTATIIFARPFQFTPGIIIDQANDLSALVTSLSGTSCTLTGTTSTGFIFLEGF